MKKLTHALIMAGLVGGAFAAANASAADAPASPHTFTGNVTIASEYIYRGIGQTNRKPALQGGFDYSHSSGFYAGIWGSNISWLADGNQVAGSSCATSGPCISSSIELDVYGGYKGTITGDLGFDVGVL